LAIPGESGQGLANRRWSPPTRRRSQPWLATNGESAKLELRATSTRLARPDPEILSAGAGQPHRLETGRPHRLARLRLAERRSQPSVILRRREARVALELELEPGARPQSAGDVGDIAGDDLPAR